MNGNIIWTAWFAAVAIPGTVVEVGLQTDLGLPVGYGFFFILFVLGIAVAVAEIQEFLFEASEERDIMLHILTSDEDIQRDIDQELNGR